MHAWSHDTINATQHETTSCMTSLHIVTPASHFRDMPRVRQCLSRYIDQCESEERLLQGFLDMLDELCDGNLRGK